MTTLLCDLADSAIIHAELPTGPQARQRPGKNREEKRRNCARMYQRHHNARIGRAITTRPIMRNEDQAPPWLLPSFSFRVSFSSSSSSGSVGGADFVGSSVTVVVGLL